MTRDFLPVSRQLSKLSWPSLMIGLVALVLLLLPFVFSNPVLLDLMVLIFVYAGLAQAWNILGGYAGQISLGNAVFFGVGAYTSTALVRDAQIVPWIGGLAGSFLAVILALIIGYPVFRLRGHYFAIATLAIGEIAVAVASDINLIGGASGLTIPFVRDASGRPTDSWLWLQFNQDRLPYYFIAFILMVFCVLVTILLDRTKPGFYLRAIKDDQDAARSLGVHVLRYKQLAFALSAALTALIGTFYAQYILFIDPPSTMGLNLSVLISLIAILGGVGTIWGPIIGAAVLIPLGEVTRAEFGGAGAIELMIYGGLVVLISVVQPSGLMGLGQRIRHRRAPLTEPEARAAAASSSQEKPHATLD